MRALRNAVIVIVAVLLVGVALAAYRAGGGDAAASIIGKKSLRIGVKSDQPRLGLRMWDGTFKGFDVDVATYVAGRLGVEPKDLTFVGLTSNEREEALDDGVVDMVFATYSITPERKEKVTFGGPYYVAHQDILVRAGNGSIRNVSDLRGKRLCKAAGSNSWRRVTEERKVDATLVPASTYSECVTALKEGRMDAVSTDDLILAGFAAANGSGTTMVKAPFTNEKYGVGLKKGDVAGCQAVNRYLTEMYQNGAAKTLLTEWFGSVDFAVGTSVPEFEGCT
ncbi:glutamate ABC transporter substrate-binding protein [Actinomadura sp. KC06]|uniref:glutamate ABC transporter substrate-binding protein n=1 Tax=Actinomadura sp. KC06 TaxID=2530369 RepID=UPI001049B31F|nr:glutamate ABC transporter substrate-binding protein [Actinomadura sp. KC06]TDD15523.1 glutamate ABC transporter substrate-binding protein [Actinomadura sp. KC06]